MHKGTMIEELIAAVERAEQHARTLQPVLKIEKYEIPVEPQFMYDTRFVAQMGAA